MDPRHPELAIDRMVELMTQFNLILKDMKHTTVSAQLGQLEREGGLVVQEICLVAPRLHEAMMQASRQRRHDLSHGVAFNYTPEEKVGEYTKATIAIKEEPKEEEPKPGMMDEETADKILDAVEKVAPKPKKKRKYTKKATK